MLFPQPDIRLTPWVIPSGETTPWFPTPEVIFVPSKLVSTQGKIYQINASTKGFVVLWHSIQTGELLGAFVDLNEPGATALITIITAARQTGATLIFTINPDTGGLEQLAWNEN